MIFVLRMDFVLLVHLVNTIINLLNIDDKIYFKIDMLLVSSHVESYLINNISI